MAIVSTDYIGSNNISTSDADPYLYLKQGVLFWITHTGFNAFRASGTGASIIVIDGALRGERSAVLLASGTELRLTVGATGSVEGRISAFNNFVDETAMFLTNHGIMTSMTGPTIDAGNEAQDSVAAKLVVTSTGTIAAEGGVAIDASAGADIIRNSGAITGDIYLGSGGDVYDGRNGYVVGQIYGENGDDVYNTDEQDEIVEFFDGGFDQVNAFGDFALPDYVETLVLRGAALNGWGNAQSNILIGTSRNNSLSGASGDDTIVGGLGADRLSGGDGIDTVAYYDSQTGVLVNLTNGVNAGGTAEGDILSGFENISGSTFNDTLIGNQGANELTGESGNDTLRGMAGNDILVGGIGADILDGGDGSDTAEYGNGLGVSVNLVTGVVSGGHAEGDTLISIEHVNGGRSADAIVGNNSNNILRGYNANDVLLGGGGSDALYGEANDDTLAGNAGADRFCYADMAFFVPGGWGNDRIVDFEDGIDRIDFRGASQINSMADLTRTAQGAHVLITTSDGSTILVANITVANLTASDFLFD